MSRKAIWMISTTNGITNLDHTKVCELNLISRYKKPLKWMSFNGSIRRKNIEHKKNHECQWKCHWKGTFGKGILSKRSGCVPQRYQLGFFYSKMSSFVSYHFWKSTLGWLKIKYILYKNTMSWKLIFWSTQKYVNLFFIGKNVKLTQNSQVFLDELGKTGSIKFKFKSIWFFIF